MIKNNNIFKNKYFSLLVAHKKAQLNKKVTHFNYLSPLFLSNKRLPFAKENYNKFLTKKGKKNFQIILIKNILKRYVKI